LDFGLEPLLWRRRVDRCREAVVRAIRRADDDFVGAAGAACRAGQDIDHQAAVFVRIRALGTLDRGMLGRLGNGGGGKIIHRMLFRPFRRDQTSWLVSIGSLRTRLPVSLNSALASAGMTGGRAGSPMPVGGLSVITNSV